MGQKSCIEDWYVHTFIDIYTGTDQTIAKAIASGRSCTRTDLGMCRYHGYFTTMFELSPLSNIKEGVENYNTLRAH